MKVVRKKVEYAPVLSILIASLEERADQFAKLSEKLSAQIMQLEEPSDVEIIYAIDKRTDGCSIGEKRNILMNNVRGKFFCFVDDDDDISDDYIKEIVFAIRSNPNIHVVSFDIAHTVTGRETQILNLSINHKAGFFFNKTSNSFKRHVNHLCPVLTSVCSSFKFGCDRYGEDEDWIKLILKSRLLKHECHIGKVLYHYNFNPSTSATHEFRVIPYRKKDKPRRMDKVITPWDNNERISMVKTHIA